MANLSTDSVAPAEVLPTETYFLDGKTEAARFSERVKSWISSLSPAGATVHDTGWVTAQTGTSSIPTVQVRRRGKEVWVSVDGTITSLASAGSVTYTGIIAAAYRPTANVRFFISLGGAPSVAVVGANGDLQLTNQTGAARTSVNYSLAHYPLAV